MGKVKKKEGNKRRIYRSEGWEKILRRKGEKRREARREEGINKEKR